MQPNMLRCRKCLNNRLFDREQILNQISVNRIDNNSKSKTELKNHNKFMKQNLQKNQPQLILPLDTKWKNGGKKTYFDDWI